MDIIAGLSSEGNKAIRDNGLTAAQIKQLSEDDIRDLLPLFADRVALRKFLSGSNLQLVQHSESAGCSQHIRQQQPVETTLAHMSADQLLSSKRVRGKPTPEQIMCHSMLRSAAKSAGIWRKAHTLSSISTQRRQSFEKIVLNGAPQLASYMQRVWVYLGKMLQNRRKYLLDKEAGKRVTLKKRTSGEHTSQPFSLEHQSHFSRPEHSSHPSNTECSSQSPSPEHSSQPDSPKQTPQPSSLEHQSQPSSPEHQSHFSSPEHSSQPSSPEHSSQPSSPEHPSHVVAMEWNRGKVFLGVLIPKVGAKQLVQNCSKPIFTLSEDGYEKDDSYKYTPNALKLNKNDIQEPIWGYSVWQIPVHVASCYPGETEIQVTDEKSFKRGLLGALKVYCKHSQ